MNPQQQIWTVIRIKKNNLFNVVMAGYLTIKLKFSSKNYFNLSIWIMRINLKMQRITCWYDETIINYAINGIMSAKKIYV